MSDKEIEVRCPCCESVLVVDVRSRAVLRHVPPAQLDELGKPILDPKRWDQAQDRVRDRSDKAQDAFDSALAKEKGRGRDLDDLFDQVKKRVDRKRDPE